MTGQFPAIASPTKRPRPSSCKGRHWTRAAATGIAVPIGNHLFCATGITNFLENGGSLENAQEMAAHESPRTTKFYDRTKERLTQDEVERIRV